MVVRVLLVGRVFLGAGFEVRTVSVLAVSGRARDGARCLNRERAGVPIGNLERVSGMAPERFLQTGNGSGAKPGR